MKPERGNGKGAWENEAVLNKPVRQGARASIAISARELAGSIYQPVAIAEAAYGQGEEVGLIGCEPGLPIHAPLTPRLNRTSGRMQQDEAARAPTRPTAAINRCWRCTFVVRASWLIVMAALHPVATTGSSTFPCVQSQLREPKTCPLASFRGSPA